MGYESGIVKLLKLRNGRKGREIANELKADRKEVNSTLWRMRNQGMVRQDNTYRWFIVEMTTERPTELQQPSRLLTKLGELCRYYLQCLSLDDEAGVRLFARSNFDLDYVELPEVPGIITDQLVTAFPGVVKLFYRFRSGRERKVPCLGFPVRLKRVTTPRWEGFMLEPVFLFGFGDEALRHGSNISLSEEMPALNSSVVKSLAMGNDAFAMEEAAKLAEELGLGESEIPDFEEVTERLTQIRSEWDWREPINVREMSKGAPLSQLEIEGIYNRCIVFGYERSPYTKGLELELAKLQQESEERYRSTALGMWLHGGEGGQERSREDDSALLEPLPLNSEQREAISHALSHPLTVITGPPGTGKSQVVSSLLINAAKLGRRVLFASKNNKAVDVVEMRVNNLGPRPILLRMGRGEYQAKLTEYLTALLASRATDEDCFNHDEAERRFKQTLSQIQGLHQTAVQTVELRNQLDLLEQRVEPLRKELGEARFQSFRALDDPSAEQVLNSVKATVRAATRREQDFLTRLLWCVHRSKRFEELGKTANALQPVFEELGLTSPEVPRRDREMDAWLEFAIALESRIEAVRQIGNYFGTLTALSEAPALERIWEGIVEQQEKLATDSLRLWECWLRLAPARLSSRDRAALGEFAAVLRLLVQGDAENQRVGRQVFAQYFKLFPSVVSMLSCWAVTSLSTRGRVPLEPGFFDLVVIDEASQCDIASALPLLFRAKAAVIIGDPKQLRHISGIPARRDRELLARHGLVETCVSWAYSENSLFDLASHLAGRDDIIMLRDHHRSHADIIEFSNLHFYEGRLRIATKYERLRRPTSEEPVVRWVPVRGTVTRPGHSALNEVEAKAVVAELERIAFANEYHGTIGVVTPFRAHANRIRDLIHGNPRLANVLARNELLVDVAHCFQGDERDVMIFSPVVSDGISKGALGFLNSTGNLFNVAITRARAALVVVGDASAARTSGVSYLHAFADYVARLGQRQAAQSSASVPDDAGPHYPAVARPDLVSDWERAFYYHLWQAGLRPIPQYAEEKFLLDFALFSDGRKLNIEVDGERYHRSWNGELLRRDQLRNMRLIELGWDVQRFWVYQLRDEMSVCVDRVRNWFGSQRQSTTV